MVADLQMVKGEMNSLKKRLIEAEELNEILRREKNEEIDKLALDYEKDVKEKAKEIERLKNALEEERMAKVSASSIFSASELTFFILSINHA